MGNINCSNCNNTKDILSEIKSESSSKGNPSIHHEGSVNSNDFAKIVKDLKNQYTDYSFALFQRFNLIRTEPLKFYSESSKYNLSEIIEELIDKSDITLKLTWSTKKEKIINRIMKDKRIIDIRQKLNLIKKYFSKEFDIKIYYAKGNFAKIDDALWHVLYGLKNLGEDKLKKFLTEKIDYCVIYSMNENEMIFENENDKSEEIKEQSNNNLGDIISFFILFNYNFNIH